MTSKIAKIPDHEKQDSNKRYVLGDVICDLTSSKCEYPELPCRQCPKIDEEGEQGKCLREKT